MLTQTNSIVLLWLLPVLLHIVLPLTLLAGWLLLKPFITFKQHEREKKVTHAGVDTVFSTPEN